MPRITDIYNYVVIDELLATAGQPSEEQMATVAAEGFELVINLALHTDPRYSLPDETTLVKSLGMDYVHIPVQFKTPTEADLLAFFAAMDANEGRKTLVHCAANVRVTAFLGLYDVIRHDKPADEAFALMQSMWERETVRSKGRDEATEKIWADFIAAMLAKPRAAFAPAA